MSVAQRVGEIVFVIAMSRDRKHICTGAVIFCGCSLVSELVGSGEVRICPSG